MRYPSKAVDIKQGLHQVASVSIRGSCKVMYILKALCIWSWTRDPSLRYFFLRLTLFESGPARLGWISGTQRERLSTMGERTGDLRRYPFKYHPRWSEDLSAGEFILPLWSWTNGFRDVVCSHYDNLDGRLVPGPLLLMLCVLTVDGITIGNARRRIEPKTRVQGAFVCCTAIHAVSASE